jgi:hypothetical protein
MASDCRAEFEKVWATEDAQLQTPATRTEFHPSECDCKDYRNLF